MSLANFTELKTSVETWRERAGDSVVTTNAEDCIKLGEAKLNRVLPLREMWVNHPLTGTQDEREIALPADYVESTWLKSLTGGEFRELRRRNPDVMVYQSTAGDPEKWTVNGSNIDLNRPCSSALSFQFRYRKKFSLATTTTNWLLTNHPDVYLAAVLVWSGLLLKDDDIAVWKGLLEEAINELSWIESREPVTLSTDPGLWRNRNTDGPIISEDFSGDFG